MVVVAAAVVLVVAVMVVVAAAMQEPCSFVNIYGLLPAACHVHTFFLSDEMLPLAGPQLLPPAAFAQPVCWCAVCVVELPRRRSQSRGCA